MNKYNTTKIFLFDFEIFIKESDYSDELKNRYIKYMYNIKPCLDKWIEKKDIVFKKTAKALKEKGCPRPLYDKMVSNIYTTHTSNLRDDYKELIYSCGLIYIDNTMLNRKLKITSKGQFDTNLVYFIAGWVKEHLCFSCLKNKTKDMLAADLTAHIVEKYGTDF